MVVSSNSSDGRKEIRKNLYAVVEEILTIHLKFYHCQIQTFR